MWLEKTLDPLLFLIQTVFYSVILYNTSQETSQKWCMSILSTRGLFLGLNHKLMCSYVASPPPSSTIGTCVKMEHHKYWDSPLIHLAFIATLQWAAAYARMRGLVCRKVEGKDLNAGMP